MAQIFRPFLAINLIRKTNKMNGFIHRNTNLKIGIFHLFRRPFRFFNFLFFISFLNNKTNISEVISINLEINLILRSQFKPIRNKTMQTNDQTMCSFQGLQSNTNFINHWFYKLSDSVNQKRKPKAIPIESNVKYNPLL
jgi:hypothetical protein